MKNLFFTILVLSSLILAGCRGAISKNPPVHISPNMDIQEKFDPQEANAFFEDGRAMRPPVAGTVARGFLREDVAFYQGRASDGSLVKRIPVHVSKELVLRGRERFNIYCAPCHGQVGDGKGPISTGGYGIVPAPTYHTQRLIDESDGYFFDAITNGIRTMPSYAAQVPVADRWAIVSYIRALQKSQNASSGDVPLDVLDSITGR